MTAKAREIRIRVATVGAAEVEGNVDFTIEIDTRTRVPAVTGSLVHPLDGATEIRPFTVEAIDKAGALIEELTTPVLELSPHFRPGQTARWNGLGRLCDVQWRDKPD